MTHDPRERFEELMAEQVLGELTSDQREELERLGRELGLEIGSDGLDETAALLALGLAADGAAEVPADLRARLEADADAHFGAAPAAPVEFPTERASRGTPLGWIAAAACLALAAWGWWGQDGPPPVPTPDMARAELLASGEAVQLDWTATADEAAVGASGDVVWSAVVQEGYMRISGLAANDPLLWQYQLWIFDAERDERYPVDGGVFDITPDGEVIVPINAAIPVGEAVLFAVTVEKPGGVVVSDRERIVLVAQAG